MADTLSITDNRTGKTYEVDITDETIKGIDLRQIKVNEDDFGMMAYDPGYTNTASCQSAITYIDGEAGILQHRGYTIEELCEKSSYLEVAYLLIFGELPTEPQLERWVYDVTHHTFVHEDMKAFYRGFRHDAHPMGILLAGVGAMSTFYPDAKEIDYPEERYMAAIRLIAKMPTLAAFSYRHSLGLPYVYPDNELDYSSNFLAMMRKMTEVKYEPDPAAREGPRRPLHPPRRSRAELLDGGRPRRRLLAGRSLLGGRRGRRRPLRPAPRRRQRGGAEDAAPDREGREHPRLPRGREEARGEADGLRPPRLQELRPAGADHQEARRRGARDDRRQPAARHRHRAREAARSTTSTSPRASSTRTSTSTRA